MDRARDRLLIIVTRTGTLLSVWSQFTPLYVVPRDQIYKIYQGCKQALGTNRPEVWYAALDEYEAVWNSLWVKLRDRPIV